MAAKGDRDSREALWPRALAFAVLLVGVDLWCERHLGFGIENPVGLLGLTSAVTFGSHLLDRLLKKRERGDLDRFIEKRFRRMIEWLLGWTVLGTLAVACLIMASSVSSLVIVPPAQGSAADAELSSLGPAVAVLEQRNLGASPAPVRFLVATTPFGRALRLRVSGYSTRIVTVFPLAGLTIDVASDLVALPTIYFRPSVDGLVSLKEGGRFRLFKRETLVAESPAGQMGAAFVVGTRRQVPPSYLPIWQLELQAQGVTGEPFGEVMLAWSRPSVLAATAELAPGDEIQGVICAPSKQKVSEALITIDREPFQDIAMRAPSADVAAGKVCS